MYVVFLLGLGVYFFKNSKSQSDYFIGGRNLNVWVTSMSAQASDMSGWLLMGLPGTAFLLSENSGMAGAVWTGIGLAVGTYLNWLFLAKRFRQYTEHADDSITIPSYLENRFKDKTNLIRLISAIFIVFFFLIYTAAQFSAGAKLFDVVFGLDYSTALFAGAFVIIAYTFLGGFLAVCWSDLIQGILMFFAIVILPIVAIFELGGVEMTFQTAASLVDGTKQLGVEEWFGFESMGLLGIVSTAAWGLGYFGQPHILARFMGIKKASDVKPARRIATVWVVITLTASIFLGVIGRAYMATTIGVDAAGQIDGERIFIYMVQHILSGPFFAIIAGILLTAILSAIMSTADSQLL
ncbi:MAG TPA: sodium:proline symporter, partial [Eubacteriaceae bacterium]|nr:sodium:proline symporter [Eubacteriaceae bacterium]